MLGPVAVADVMTVRVVTVSRDETVQVAIARMLEENIGSVAVCDGPRLVGIFTERDVLRAAGEGNAFLELTVDTVMTPRPLTIAPEDDLIDAARLMGERRIRHLPVTQGDFLIGMVGIRDVLGRLVEQVAQQDSAARETARSLLQRTPRA